MSDAESLQPGSVFADRYRVERLIGAGGYARVYRAIQTDLDRCVALKVLRPFESAETADAIAERFYREARVLSQLRDEHTITIYDYSQTDAGTLYMVSEYIEGEDLSAVLAQRGTMSEAAARHVLVQVLKSLREAHRHGILHRDIKPSNIMLYEHFGERDRVKLIDFGIAKSLVSNAPDLTIHGAVVGTPRYMSPDQLRGEPLSPASDLFSLGLVLYEMLVGTSPFDSRDAREIYDVMERFRHSLGPLESKGRDIREVARRLLEPSRDDRYDSAEDVLADLEGTPQNLHRAVSTSRRAPAMGSPSFPLEFDRSGATPATALTELDFRVGDAAHSPKDTLDTLETQSASESLDPTIEDRVAPRDFTTQDADVAASSRLPWLWGLGVVVALLAAVMLLTPSPSPPEKTSAPAPVADVEPKAKAPGPAAIEAAYGEARSGVAGALAQSTSRAHAAGADADANAEETADAGQSRQPERPLRHPAAREPRDNAPRDRVERADEPNTESDDDSETINKPTFEAFDQLEP